jgi:phosphoglycolate phosphatase-like HAD superfamily hydrolase
LPDRRFVFQSLTAMSINCFIFDFDGTPAHSEPACRAAGARTAALWGGASAERLPAQAPDFALPSPHHLLDILPAAR